VSDSWSYGGDAPASRPRARRSGSPATGWNRRVRGRHGRLVLRLRIPSGWAVSSPGQTTWWPAPPGSTASAHRPPAAPRRHGDRPGRADGGRAGPRHGPRHGHRVRPADDRHRRGAGPAADRGHRGAGGVRRADLADGRALLDASTAPAPAPARPWSSVRATSAWRWPRPWSAAVWTSPSWTARRPRCGRSTRTWARWSRRP
jgi:hypothetical protein